MTWPRRSIGQDLDAVEAGALQLEAAATPNTAKFLLTARLDQGNVTTFVVPGDDGQAGDDVVTWVRTSETEPWVGVHRTALRDVRRLPALAFLISWPDASRTLVVLAAPASSGVRVLREGGIVSDTLALDRGLGVYAYNSDSGPTGVFVDPYSGADDPAPLIGSISLRTAPGGIPSGSQPSIPRPSRSS